MQVSRRDILAGLSLLPLTASAREPAAPVQIGAIRWDAWYSKSDNSVFPQNNLAPASFRSRAPAHCVQNGEDLSCTGTIDVIEAEIAAAQRARLSFWAFGWYPANTSLRKAWDFYQSAPSKRSMPWCAIVGFGDLGSARGAIAERDKKLRQWVGRMKQDDYFRADVAGAKRPLLFIFYREKELQSYFRSLEALGEGLSRFRELARAEGGFDPYIVLFDPALDMALFKGSGVDAISNYIGGFQPKERGSFAELDRQVQDYWRRMALTGAPMVPIAQVGWDTRPRREHPVPWSEPGYGDPTKRNLYYAMASPEELTAHLLAARRFGADHAAQCSSRLVLLYSWNECDEGGCVLPTLGDRRGHYLAAIARAAG